jgi:hypothetical protein
MHLNRQRRTRYSPWNGSGIHYADLAELCITFKYVAVEERLEEL